jgi:hypothetical protein
MMSREHRGLQAALILFTMLTVMLAVTSYVYFRRAHERSLQLAAAVRAKQNALQAFQAENARVQLLQHILGEKTLSREELATLRRILPPAADVTRVEAAFRQDVTSALNTLPASDMHYRGAVQNLKSVVHERNADLVAATQREASLTADKAAIRDGEQRRVEQAERASHDARQDLDQERQRFNEQLVRVQDDRNRLAAALAESRQAQTELATAHQVELEKLRNEATRWRLLYDKAVETIAGLKGVGTGEHPDGRIVWASQQSGTVVIDVGADDGLQRQTTFVVFDQAAATFAGQKPKARIEVTQIKDAHSAEARIVTDELANPIVPGDKVFSAIWNRGRKMRFALAGFLDLDGDGNADASKVRSLITLNGGLIDAELLEGAEPTGRMALETQLLIVGTRPDERSDASYRTGFSQMIEDASRLGIEAVPLGRFIERIGCRP